MDKAVCNICNVKDCEMIMWIARDKDGELFIYTNKPVRRISVFDSKDVNTFYNQISSAFYPEVTWENSPKELVVKEESV